MTTRTSFGDALEAVEHLSLDEQETFLEILQRRIIERRREELANDISEAQHAFQAGQSRPVTPEELLREILS